ncbi:MAG: hypothetical protein JRF69_07155 [Deltaproteobacteria bacterium]|nr:hypothetical protein [Deltaproteobacteria bacterium]
MDEKPTEEKPTEEKSFDLDETAELLFQQIEGVEFRELTALGKALTEEERQLNVFRSHLVDLVHLLGKCLEDSDLVKDAERGKKFVTEFLGVLRKLSQMPNHDGKVLIRFRGLKSGPDTLEETDYVVLFSNLVFDMATAAAMVQHLDEYSTDFQKRLNRGFEVFSEYGVNNLFLEIPDDVAAASKAMWISLYTLSRCKQALSKDAPAAADDAAPGKSFPLIHDEQGQPDINLTLLGKVNNLKTATMTALVTKVDTWMQGPNYKASDEGYSSVYNAILGNQKLREKLKPPPLEVNNIKWLMVDNEYEVVSKRKTDVARLVIGTYGDSPQETAKIMGSVYGDDFQEIDSQNLGERLRLASNLMTSIEEKDAAEPVMEEVVENVEQRLDQVPDDTYDSLEVDGDVIKAKHRGKWMSIGKIHEKVKAMVGFFKARSDVKKKMENLAERGITFDESDFKVIAKDFDISTNEARKLIEAFQNCFDEEATFLRDAFSRNIPQFAKYKKKIFEFLWHYLKQMTRREDRVALLNSLQMLIPKLKQPKTILKILLTDFSSAPDGIVASDRSVLVLTTLLISNYNKETGTDIEITPEEVLATTKDLDPKLAAEASKLIDGTQDKFFKKFRTIHRKLNELLVRSHSEGETMSLRDVFLLEREVYIFLSLVGGTTARALLRSAAQVFGNPRGSVYRFNESERFLPNLLQLLKIASRGLGRLGAETELSLLDEIVEREGEFYETIAQTGSQEHLKRAMEFVRESQTKIASRTDYSKTAPGPATNPA